MKFTIRIAVIIGLLVLESFDAQAKIRLPAIFTGNMVLQQQSLGMGRTWRGPYHYHELEKGHYTS